MNKCSQVNQVIGGGRVVDFTVLKVLYSKRTVKCSIFKFYSILHKSKKSGMMRHND